MRRSLLISSKQALADDHAGVSVGVAFHAAAGARDQGRTWGIAFRRTSCIIASNQRTTTRTFTTGIARVHPTDHHAIIPGFVFTVVMDSPSQPVGTLLVGAAAVLALLWLEVAKMLEDQNTGPMLLRKLDNAATHQMRVLLIERTHVGPQMRIILFPFGNHTGLAPVAGYSSQESRAFGRAVACPCQ